MSKMKNKIVFITGASSGMGKACAQEFAMQGARLILTARRLDRLETLAAQLKQEYGTDVLTVKLDIQDKQQIQRVVDELPKEWQEIDILLNNAGLCLSSVKMQEGNMDDWDVMINTNFRGLLYITRTLLTGMVARDTGHIINISSTAGHGHYPAGNVYSATKHAVSAISKSLRIDLLGTAIRVTEIAPGLTETEFSEVRWKDKEKAKAFYSDFTQLSATDIAETVVFCATRPPHVDIAEVLIYPTHQGAPGYVHKKERGAKGTFD